MAGLNISHHQGKTEKRPSSFSLVSLLNQDIKLFSSGKILKDKQKESFYLELNTLLSAGMDLRAALDLIEEEFKGNAASEVIAQIKARVVSGAGFSESLAQSKSFTPYEYYSVKIGEETGKLTVVLHELSRYYTQKIKQKRQMVSALSYPVLILCTSLGAVSFMLYFIVPMFSEVFARFGGELPYLTRQIIAASVWLENYFLLLIAIAIVIVIGIVSVKHMLWYQKLTTSIIRRIPLIGKLYTHLHLARFCTAMALLTGAKIPLLNAITLTEKMISFYPIQVSLKGIKADITQGKHLHESLAAYAIYDPRLLALIKVGEEVNALDTFFAKLSEQYQENVEHQTALLSTFLEPVVIILLGMMVGFILVAMYLPMFELSSGITG